MNSSIEELAGPYVDRIVGSSRTRFSVAKITGDASNREYFRIQLDSHRGPDSLVLMKFDPENAYASEEAASKESRINSHPFLDIGDFLARTGIPAPAIYDSDLSKGVIFLEDLGDTMMYDEVSGDNKLVRLKWYKKAIDLLIEFQKIITKDALLECIAFHRSFSNNLLMWEFDHYLEYGVEVLFKSEIDSDDRDIMTKYFMMICDELNLLPQVLVHRDYQSRNLMVHNGELAVIDFQDALIGPQPYDLVALLRDSYIALSVTQIEELLKYYYEQSRSEDYLISFEQFRRGFYLQTIQRKLKDSGRFVFIDRVKKNPWFLQFIPNSLMYVKHALSQVPEYEELASLLARYEKRLEL